jgi:hypothetical protein
MKLIPNPANGHTMDVLQQLGNSQIILVRLTTENEIHTSRLIRVD